MVEGESVSCDSFGPLLRWPSYDIAHSLPRGGVDRGFPFTEDETTKAFLKPLVLLVCFVVIDVHPMRINVGVDMFSACFVCLVEYFVFLFVLFLLFCMFSSMYYANVKVDNIKVILFLRGC